MGDRQQDDIAGAHERIGRGDDAGRAIFALILTCGGFTLPEIVVADDEAGLWFGKRQDVRLLQQFVEVRVLRVHFGPIHRVDHHIGGVHCAMRSLHGRTEPIIVIGGHQNKLAPPVSGNLHGLALRVVLELTEFTLKL
jgi:hypothetical protein